MSWYSNSDHVEKKLGQTSEVYVVTEPTKAHDAIANVEGEPCELDHNHSKSHSCVLKFQCDEWNCGAQYDTETEAEECCVEYTCTHCGYDYSTRDSAEYCCHYSCDDCGFEGWPEDHEEHECDNGNGAMRRAMPWEERGIKVDARYPDAGENWESNWDIKPADHDVVRAAADFYLLDALTAGIVGTTDGRGNVNRDVADSSIMRTFRAEAQIIMDEIVQVWDPIFQSYTHMAVGGELRHHNAISGEVLPSNRDMAWNGWKLIYEAVGPDALTDAAVLFREFTGGAYGGQPWAIAAEILHARITNKISPQMFLDRIFNAQHNGGCLLNKVNWKNEGRGSEVPIWKRVGVDELTNYVLPAHGQDPEPDYSVLLAYATPRVRSLFFETYEAAGHAFIALGYSLSMRAKRPRKGTTRNERAYADEKAAAAVHAKYQHIPGAVSAAEVVQHYMKYTAHYAKYAESEEATNAKAALCKPVCACDKSYIDTYGDCEYKYHEHSLYYSQTYKEYKIALDKAKVTFDKLVADYKPEQVAPKKKAVKCTPKWTVDTNAFYQA